MPTKKPTLAVKIRKATMSDVAAIRCIANAPGLTNPGNAGCVPHTEWFKVQVRGGILLVATRKTKVVGFIMGEKLLGTVVMVWMMGVTEKLRGQGIGKALMNAFHHECTKQGKNIFVAYAYAKNPVIIKLLKKYGFNQGHLYYEFIKLPKSWK